MKKTVCLLFIMLFSIMKSSACSNYYYALDKEGNLLPLGYNWKFPFNKNFNLELNVTKLKKLEKKLKAEKNYMLLSDYSVCLMKLGKQKEALEILIQLYKHYPNEYKIAANLGTVYELNGQVDSALKYIKRDLQLNPNDHEGSEWIHVKVLETKLELKNNSAYLNNHTVLQLTEAQKKDTITLQHISIQLQERVPFTPSTTVPDDIMASLFIDMGDISANVKSIEYARVYYLIAKKYYGSKLAFLDGKIKDMEKLMNKYASVKPKYDEHFEGSQEKIGYIRYQELLDDNNDQHYKINWAKINTNVDSLLALVDFTRTAQEVKNIASSIPINAGDELKIIPEIDSLMKTDSLVKTNNTPVNNEKQIEEKQKKSESSHTWIYAICIFVLICIGFFIIKFLKK